MKVFNNVDFKEWQEIVDKCKYSTFFHTPTWSKIFVKTYPNMKISTKKFVLDDQTSVILPLVNERTAMGLCNSYFSNIAGVYGIHIVFWISSARSGLYFPPRGQKRER